MFSSFYGFTNEDVSAVEEAGPPLDERGKPCVPCSDHSSDAIAVLERMTARRREEIKARDEGRQCEAKRIRIPERRGALLRDLSGRADAKVKVVPDRVILATGGVSYPQGTGHDGLKRGP